MTYLCNVKQENEIGIMRKELTTLSGIYRDARDRKKNPMSEDEVREINLKLLLLVQLSTMQANIAWEIEQTFRKHDVFGFNIKHNHKKIVELIKGCGNSDFWSGLTSEQIDAICSDADTLEDIVYRWCGLK